MAALQHQQQQQQRSRMLGLMQSQTSGINQAQFPAAAAARMPSSSFANNTAPGTPPRGLFPSATESSAPSSDSGIFYPRQPPPPQVLSDDFIANSDLPGKLENMQCTGAGVVH